MKRALIAAVLSALATAAVLATIGFGAANKSSSGTSKKSSKGQSSQTSSGPPPTMKEALADAEKRRAAQQEKLAKALGVSVDKLQSALDSIKKEQLDEAVKDNKLTEAQRDAILACDKAPLTCDRSNLPAYGFGPGFGHFGGPGLKGFHRFRGGPLAGSDFVKELASELGISEDKVTSALRSVRPALPERGLRRFRHGPGRGHHGWKVPPPPNDDASGTMEVVPAPIA
jgi:hypothetical protein